MFCFFSDSDIYTQKDYKKRSRPSTDSSTTFRKKHSRPSAGTSATCRRKRSRPLAVTSAICRRKRCRPSGQFALQGICPFPPWVFLPCSDEENIFCLCKSLCLHIRKVKLHGFLTKSIPWFYIREICVTFLYLLILLPSSFPSNSIVFFSDGFG